MNDEEAALPVEAAVDRLIAKQGYQVYRKIEDQLRDLLTVFPPTTQKKLVRGEEREVEILWCEYTNPDMNDAKAADMIGKVLGVNITPFNIAFIRNQMFGRLRKITSAGPTAKRLKLTQRVEALETRLEAAGLPVDNPALHKFMGRLASVEKAVDKLVGSDSSRDQAFREMALTVNHLRDRVDAVVSLVSEQTPHNLESQLRKQRLRGRMGLKKE